MQVRTRAYAGTRTRTYRLQDSFSSLTMVATSGFVVSRDRSHDFSGTSGREFVSQVVSRRGEMLASMSYAVRTTASPMLATTATSHWSTGIAIRARINHLLSPDCYPARSSRRVHNQHRADQRQSTS